MKTCTYFTSMSEFCWDHRFDEDCKLTIKDIELKENNEKQVCC